MAAWLPETSDTYYIGPISACVIVAILFVLGQKYTTLISADILENCEPDTIKESVKGAWTNVGVTAALMLTLVVAMLQVDPITPVGFNPEEEALENLANIQQTYITFISLSLLGNATSMLQCVVYLGYIDPLSNTDAIKFFLYSPDCIGDPITFLVISCILMLLGMSLWVFGSYGLLQAIIFMSASILTIFFLVKYSIQPCSSFNPAQLPADHFAWTQEEPSKWKSRKESGSKFSEQGDTAQVRRVVVKLGKAIQNAEQKTKP